MKNFAALSVMLGLVASASAGTFTATINAPGSATVGEPVSITIMGDLTNDNDGLAFVSMDFGMSGPDEINLGSALALGAPAGGSMDNFVQPLGYDANYGGTPVGNNLVQAGGAQNTIGNNPAADPFLAFPSAEFIDLNVGHGGQVIFEGTITFPEGTTEGTYTLSLANVLANAISEGATPGSFAIYPVEAVDTVAGDSVDIEVLDCAAPAFREGMAGISFEDRAFDGYIDPRMESSNGVDVNLGIDRVTVQFNVEVQSDGGAALSAADFDLTQSDAGDPPVVTAIETEDNTTVTLVLDRTLSLGCTTITASVENVCANTPISEDADSITIGYHPADVDNGGSVQPLDLLRMRQAISGTVAAPSQGVVEDFYDIDRNGSIQALDLLRWRQLWFGSGNATQAWQGTSIGCL